MPKRIPEGHCPICEQYMDVVVSGCDPWFDGKDYKAVCFTCHSLIKTGEVIVVDEENEIYDWKEYNDSAVHLHTVQEMLEDGWDDKKEIQESIRGVKAAMRKAKKRVARTPQQNKPSQKKKKPGKK